MCKILSFEIIHLLSLSLGSGFFDSELETHSLLWLLTNDLFRLLALQLLTRFTIRLSHLWADPRSFHKLFNPFLETLDPPPLTTPEIDLPSSLIRIHCLYYSAQLKMNSFWG